MRLYEILGCIRDCCALFTRWSIPSRGQLTENATGFSACLLRSPRRSVSPDGVPALLAVGAELEHVVLVATPGSHTKAAQFGIPQDSVFERVDRPLGDLSPHPATNLATDVEDIRENYRNKAE